MKIRTSTLLLLASNGWDVFFKRTPFFFFLPIHYYLTMIVLLEPSRFRCPLTAVREKMFKRKLRPNEQVFFFEPDTPAEVRIVCPVVRYIVGIAWSRPFPGERTRVPDNHDCPCDRRVRSVRRCVSIAGDGGQPESPQDSERRTTRPRQQPVRGRFEDGTFRRQRQLLYRNATVTAVRVDRRTLRRAHGFRRGSHVFGHLKIDFLRFRTLQNYYCNCGGMGEGSKSFSV